MANLKNKMIQSDNDIVWILVLDRNKIVPYEEKRRLAKRYAKKIYETESEAKRMAFITNLKNKFNKCLQIIKDKIYA